MILYNTTFCIDEPQEDKFVDFMKDVYIPAAYACGLYNGLLTKIRVPREQNALNGQYAVSYALQLRASSGEAWQMFTGDVLPHLFETMDRSLSQSMQLYCTELDVIHDHDRDGNKD